MFHLQKVAKVPALIELSFIRALALNHKIPAMKKARPLWGGLGWHRDGRRDQAALAF
jgi:hypothetical protein